jgi:flagellar hook-associated protein 3 FlgL
MATFAIANLQKNLREVTESQDRISSGLRVARPSDDPAAASQILVTNTTLRQNGQYLRNIEQALARTQTEEESLGAAADLLMRVKEITTRAGDGLSQGAIRESVKQEVDEIFSALVGIGNASIGGIYIFAGDQGDQRPFTETALAGSPSYTSTNPTGGQTFDIAPGQTMVPNHDGSSVIHPLLDAVRAVSLALGSDDQTAILSSISGIDSQTNRIHNAIAEIGTRTNTLEGAQQRLGDQNVSLAKFKSVLREVAPEEAITALTQAQTRYQAALMATSRVMNLTLANYMQ